MCLVVISGGEKALIGSAPGEFIRPHTQLSVTAEQSKNSHSKNNKTDKNLYETI